MQREVEVLLAEKASNNSEVNRLRDALVSQDEALKAAEESISRLRDERSEQESRYDELMLLNIHI